MIRREPWPIKAFRLVALIAVSAYLLHVLTAGTDDITAPPPESSVVTTNDRVQQYLDEGICWTGDAPVGVTIPGSVLIDTTDGPKRVDRVDDALDQIFNGVDHHLAILAFCR